MFNISNYEDNANEITMRHHLISVREVVKNNSYPLDDVERRETLLTAVRNVRAINMKNRMEMPKKNKNRTNIRSNDSTNMFTVVFQYSCNIDSRIPCRHLLEPQNMSRLFIIQMQCKSWLCHIV